MQLYHNALECNGVKKVSAVVLNEEDNSSLTRLQQILLAFFTSKYFDSNKTKLCINNCVTPTKYDIYFPNVKANHSVQHSHQNL